MSENAFWITFWGMVITAVLFVLAGIGYYQLITNVVVKCVAQ